MGWFLLGALAGLTAEAGVIVALIAYVANRTVIRLW